MYRNKCFDIAEASRKTMPQQKLNTVQQNITVWPFFWYQRFLFVFWFGQAVHNYKETSLSSYTMLDIAALSNTRQEGHKCSERCQIFLAETTSHLSLDKTKQNRKNNISAHKAIVMLSKYLLGWEITHKIIFIQFTFSNSLSLCLFEWALSIGKIWHLLHGKYNFKRCTGNNTGEFTLINERGHLYEQLKWRERETCQSRTQMAWTRPCRRVLPH